MTPSRMYLMAALVAFAWMPGPGAGAAAAIPGAQSAGQYVWPVNGPVIRPFEPPEDPYSQGHRGIDIEASFGSPLRSAAAGVVAFSGWIGGALYISIDHPDGVRTTYSWLSASLVNQGQAVAGDEVIGATGHGHPSDPRTHLHFGARVGSTYIDPMTLLEPGDVSTLIRLAPLDGAGPSRVPGGPFGGAGVLRGVRRRGLL